MQTCDLLYHCLTLSDIDKLNIRSFILTSFNHHVSNFGIKTLVDDKAGPTSSVLFENQ
jgi:hypothetical protein